MPRGRRNLGLSEQRARWTVVLHRNVPEQAYVNEQIDEMVERGTFQNWIRDILIERLPLPPDWTPKPEPEPKEAEVALSSGGIAERRDE